MSEVMNGRLKLIGNLKGPRGSRGGIIDEEVSSTKVEDRYGVCGTINTWLVVKMTF